MENDPRVRQSGRPPGHVRRLPDTLVDQIAAGEVVERPASVVKELVENALDAGGQRIQVQVREGGRSWICVVDDGWGMAPEDARLALERHATSKLGTVDDLRQILSFGFRGEALPAIASVSHLRLCTRARGTEAGFELRLEGGREVGAGAVGTPEGTRVEVAQLFTQVPARRKFLKSAATEWGHIADWMGRIALALPEVHFELQRDARRATSWPATRDPLERIAAVLSDDEASGLVAVEAEQGGAQLRGFASRPDHHRATAAGLHLFVNGRPVRDRLLRHALLERYRDVLPRGRYPSAVLFLVLPPDAVDVNVHPAKWEVRFADPRAIHHLVTAALDAALGARRWLGAAPRPGPGGTSHTGAPGMRPRVGETGSSGSDWIFAPAVAEERSAALEEPPPAAHAAPMRFGELRALGQLLGTYLLAEAKGALLLVDQHAAHERVLYERLRAQWLGSGVERQALLITAPVECEPSAADALLENPEAVTALGFELEAFGESSVVVRAVPALLAERDPAALVRGLAEELRASQALGAEFTPSSRTLQAADHALATLACHSARRAGEVLAPPEQRALLEALDGIPWAATCPHGRPVAVELGLAEIERRFGRR